jgi:hypothetical protein
MNVWLRYQTMKAVIKASLITYCNNNNHGTRMQTCGKQKKGEYNNNQIQLHDVFEKDLNIKACIKWKVKNAIISINIH